MLNPRQRKHERAGWSVIYRKSPLTMSKMGASLIIARKLLSRQWIFDNCETRSTGRLVRVNLLITSAVPAANRELRAIRMNTSCGFIRADIKRNYRRAAGTAPNGGLNAIRIPFRLFPPIGNRIFLVAQWTGRGFNQITAGTFHRQDVEPLGGKNERRDLGVLLNFYATPSMEY